MKTNHQQEAINAAHNAIRPGDTLITRHQIEEEIRNRPDLYPALFSRSTTGRRRIITLAMNSRYPTWSSTDGVHPSSFVWKIKDEQDDLKNRPGEKR
ncbi:MAG TPA: hypothetical protein PLY78_12190, partial [Methanospirillum sp.]|nr:hypothetical protein [Methanospirillum sp.]